MKKILILGSGALKIGEAGEFDYSGSQAIKALKEEGIKTILINPNIATIQTSEFLADKVYFLPVTAEFVEEVIKKERPDGILLSFGGQTALNCGIDLYRKKILKKYKVEILGTPMRAIILSEDRAKFAHHLLSIGQPIPNSETAMTVLEAKKVGEKIGYPVMIRAAYTLGGQKSGVAKNIKELEKITSEALVFAPQVLIEKYLYHYKELEYEIVRDRFDNCISVCNMENFDPMGIHTGESIVVAPSQTLTNFEYHHLRKAAIEIVRSLKIVGECNVQFALNPKKYEYYVIELNARLSRSSALASKATGYPLAYVAAKLALGKSLTEIKNQVTKVTQSCFEPALDYLVAKIPRWDLEKFKGIEEKIGSSMKSVGEIMAVGRTFEETIQKAVRMLDIGVTGITDNHLFSSKKDALKYIEIATPKRIFAIVEALRQDVPIEKIYELSGIDPWFLYRIKNIVEVEKELIKITNRHSGERPSGSKGANPERNLLLHLKQLGFSDKKIGQITGNSELVIRTLRIKNKITPSIFQIDTLAGEFPAKTNYLYTTYHGAHHDVKPLGKDGVIVLGSGPYRIGSSVEFDWTCVNTALFLKNYKKKSIIINCNPETVSTDYDISNRLYFEELTFERVADIFEFEKSYGLIPSVGGQTPNNIVNKINSYGIPILGTTAESIDRVENRQKFSQLLDKLDIDQPSWSETTNIASAIAFSRKVGYPVLVRPSYVLSGSAMSLCYDEKELEYYIKKAVDINREHPVVISKFMADAKEIEFDGVAQNGEIKIYAICEHIENAGVHSGDASIVYPPQRIYLQTERKIIDIVTNLVKVLNITGPFNIQFLAKENQVSIIEMNLRASRTFPFISKATGVNFAKVIVDSFFGKAEVVALQYPNYAVVKVPQFSFARLTGADPILRVEMASTGEVACFGLDAEGAYLKSLFSAGLKIRKKNALISLGGALNKEKFLHSVWRLKNIGYKLFTTENTYRYLKEKGIKTNFVYKVHQGKKPNVVDIISSKQVSLVVVLSEKYENQIALLEKQVSDGYLIRRAAVDHNIPLFTDLSAARFFVKALANYDNKKLAIEPWDYYLKMKK